MLNITNYSLAKYLYIYIYLVIFTLDSDRLKFLIRSLCTIKGINREVNKLFYHF